MKKVRVSHTVETLRGTETSRSCGWEKPQKETDWIRAVGDLPNGQTRDLLIDWLIEWAINWANNQLIDRLIDYPIDCLIDWLSRKLLHFASRPDKDSEFKMYFSAQYLHLYTSRIIQWVISKKKRPEASRTFQFLISWLIFREGYPGQEKKMTQRFTVVQGMDRREKVIFAVTSFPADDARGPSRPSGIIPWVNARARAQVGHRRIYGSKEQTD